MTELTDEDLVSVDAAIRVLEKVKTIQQRRERDWLDSWAEGEAITTDEAARIDGCSPETIRRRAGEASDIGEPIGALFAATWLISLPRLLRDIERRKGLHARLAAETEVKKLIQSRASPQTLKNLGARCGDAHNVPGSGAV
jgi:hypothetical protein